MPENLTPDSHAPHAGAPWSLGLSFADGFSDEPRVAQGRIERRTQILYSHY